MENYTNPKSAQVINVKGEIHTDVAVDTLLQVGDVVKAGAVLNLIKGSEILLAYADGSQHKVYSYEAESVNEIRVDIISPDNNTESVDSEDINNIQNEISAIQDLIDADIDAELPETTAGLTSNEGTSFATVNRTGDETLAQAGYDTTEQNNIFVLPGDLDNENNNDNFALFDADENVTVAEDTSATGNVLDNGASAGGPLSVINFSIDGNTFDAGETINLVEGEFTLNADGSYTFIPADNFNGTVPVVNYTVTDGAGNTDSSTLTILVTPVSDLTDADESVTTAEDTSVSGNVLNNAETADGPLTITSFTVDGNTFNPGDTVTLAEGELTLNPDGSYTFIPNDNFNGSVPVVSYTVTDGAGDTDSSTLTISVTPLPDLTDDNESVTTAEDTPVSGNVLDNAATADGPLTVTSFTVNGNTFNAGDTVSLTEGELTLNADGSYTFTPNDNFNGAVPVVSYTVTDGAGDTDSSTLTISVTPVSDLTDDNESVTTAEDTPVSGNVLDNAATADGPLTVTSFTVDGNTYNAGDTVTLAEGELTLNADGSYTFTPNDNFNGAVPVVSYTVTDGAGDTDSSTLAISVTPVSDLIDDNESVTTAEDTPVSGNVLDNAATADGPLTVTSFTVNGNTFNAGDTVTLTEGELTLNADGSYTFIPNDNFNGSVPVVSYTFTDGAGDTDNSTLTISVTPLSDLTDDNESVTTAEDTAVSGNVLDNAATADGPLTVTSFTVDGNTYNAGDTVTLAEGELTLNADGSYTFTPNDNFNGAVPVVSYIVTDGAGDTDSSTLTISVTPVSDLIDDNESVTTAEDTAVSGNVLDNAATADGPLTVTSFNVDGNTYNTGDTVTLTEGELTLNTDGSYTFTPNDNFNGAVPVITYTVTDGAGDTESSTLTISVTPVSDLNDDNESVTTAEDTPVSGNVLNNADSVDGPLTVTSFTVDGDTYNAGETVSLAEGELTLNTDGSYTFTPNDNFNGAVPVISYTVIDGAGDTEVSTLTISVTPVSDLSDDSETVTIAEDTTATGNVLDNAETADGPLTVTSFTVGGNTYNAGDTVTLTEGELTLNADGSYTFTPNDNFNGSVPVITYTVTDGAGDTQSSTLTISVTPVSDLSDDSETVTIAEDTTATGNVLDNAETADGPLTVTSFTVDGNTYNAGDTVTLAEGELTLNADGSYTFTPNDNFNGSVPVVSYTVTDGAGDTQSSSLTILVTPVSDLNDDNESVTTAEDTGVSGNVLNNADSLDGPLTVTSFTVDGNTYNAGETVSLAEGELTLNTDGSYTFTPNDNFNGAVPVISYTVIDGAGDTEISTLTISVTPISDLSDDSETVTIAEDTIATGNVLDNAETADGPLTVTSFTVEGNTYNAGDTVTLTEGELTLNTDGSYTFTPNDNFNGAVPVITYTVTDGAGDTQSSTLTISVTPVSDLSDDNETVTVAEDTTATGNVLDNAETADGPLTVTSFTVGGNTYNAGDTVTLTEGELTLNTDGSYTFTPNDNFNGAVPVITYTVTDGAGDTQSSTLTISVTPVSDLNDDSETVTIAEDTTATGNVLDNAETADGPLTVTSFTVGGNTYNAGDTVTLTEGELTLNTDGSYTFTPNDDFNGAVPVITYTVTDGAGDTESSTLTISVTPVSDLSDDNETVSVAEDTTATGNVLYNAETADGPMTVTSFTVGGNTYSAGDTVTLTEGELTLNTDGSYTFTPNDNFNGAVPVISYTVTDGAGDTQSSTLTISVTPVSDLSDDSETVTIAEDTTATGNVLDNAATADGPLTVTSFTVGGNTYNTGDTVTLTEGELTLNTDGSYTFTPNDNFNGAVPVISYTVTDGAGDTQSSTLTISVTPVSDLSDDSETVSVAEDTTATGNVLDNAETADGPMTVTSFTVGGNTYNAGDTVTLTEGELTLNADGSYTFTPNDNFNGSVPVITYTVTDGAGDTQSSTLTISVTPVSDLSDDNETVTVAEDTTATGNVLDNAETADGPMTVTSFSVGGNTYNAGDTVTLAEGELTLNADGSYTFTPNDNFNGAVPVITYTVTDGAGDTQSSTLTISVTPVSDLSDDNETVSVAENTTATGNVLDNAETADAPMTVTSFTVDGNTYNAGDTVTLAEGELTLNADGSYTFTPNDNFNGAVPVISYTITDGAGDTEISTLTISVTPVSDLSDDSETVTIAEDTTATGNVLDNAETADGPLTVTSFTVGGNTYNAGDTVILTEGELTLNTDGSYTFTPNDNFNGAVPVITYTVTDGAGDTQSSTLTISVTPVSDLSDDSETVTIAEDTTATGNVLDNAATADGPLTVTSFTVGGNTYNAGDTVTLTEGELTLNTDGSYTFTPNDDFNGAVPVITYTVTDGAGDTESSTLTISVTPVSDLSDDNETVSVAEDTTATGNVLDNAETADGPMTVTSFTVGGNTYSAGDTVTLTEGELTLNTDGSYTFTPNDNFNGAVPVITYTVTDGAGDTQSSTLTISVTPVSDLSDDSETVTIAEDTTATGNVLDNAETADGPMTVTSFTVDGNTYSAGDTVTLTEGELTLNADGSYTFTPNDNFNGAVPLITYIVTDGAGDTQSSTLTISVTPVSDLSDDNETVTVAEDTTATGNVLDNAETADGPLTVTSFTVDGNTYNAGDTVSLAEGELTLNADGSYTFIPNDNFNGAVPVITYTVTDGAGDTESSTLTISVTPVSDLSDYNENVTVAEDTTATGNILDNAETADGPLTVTSFTVGGNTYNAGDTVILTEGELTLNTDGSYTFTPNDNFNGAVPVITYTVTDGAGDTQSSTLTISVTPVSDLSDDSETVTIAEDTTATGNVLDNAATADGPLTVTSFTVGGNTYNAGDTVSLAEGELTLNADGSYTFIPNDNFNGAVPVITYTVTDGAGDTESSTLTISVTPVSDLSDDNETVSVAEDATATGNVLDNAETADGPMTVTSFTVGGNTYNAGDTVTLTEGELTLNTDGSYTFTPNDNFNGAVPVITYTVTDGAGDTQSSTLTISVTPVSDLSDDSETVTIAEDTIATGNVLDNAATADGPLTVTSFTVGGNTYNAGDTVILTEGELTLNTDGSYTFTPNDNFNGAVPVISYTVTDGAGDTESSTLTISVTPFSDLTDDSETVTIAEDTIASGNVLDNAETADGPMTVTSFTVGGNTYNSGDTVTLTEGELTLNADGSYTFTPNDNFNGSVPVISYTITDGAGDTEISTLTISVTPLSDLTDDNESVTTAEDTTATGNVLDNAETADGPLTVTSFTVGGNTYSAGDTVTLTEGELTLNTDGSYTFTPNDNFNGAVPVITYIVTDGAGDTQTSTLTISVTPVSDLSDDNETVTVAEDTTATGNVLDNAETADGPLTVTSFTVGGNTYNAGDTVTLAEGELTLNTDGSYTFTPNDNFNGAVPVISYTITDGAGDTEISTLTISVTPVSDLSDDSETVTIAEDTTATGNVLDNAETADGPMTVTSFTVDGNTYNSGDTVTLTEGELTLNADGSYTFTPNDNFNGAVPVITYTVTDGAGDTQSSTLTISVTPVSDLSDDSETVSVAEDTIATGNVLDNAETADGPLTVTSFSVGGNTYNAGDTVTLAEGELTLNADGSYTFTPNDNFNGAVPLITYIVTDGAGDTQSSTLTISVTPVSDLSDDSETVTIAEDTIATGNVLDNAETADGPLTVTSFTVGGNTYNAGDTVTLAEGEITLNADGSYTFTPNDNFNGAVPVISYTITDGAGDTEISTLTISVTPVSDLSDDSETVTVAEDTTATGNVLDNAETADGPMTVTSFSVGGNTYNAGDTVTLAEGELTLNADGSYTFTPNDNFNGAVPVISYTITDGAGDTEISTLTISVTPVSDLSDDSETVTIAEDTTATGNVLDNAETADGPMTVTSFTVDGNTYSAGDTVTLTEGELTLNADGSYTFTPNDNFNGAVPVITYIVTDSAGDTQSSTLTISVTPVSDLSDDSETVTIAEDTTATGNVLDNAETADGPMTVTSFTVDGNTYSAGDTVTLTEGELTLNADGSYTFTPNDNFNGAVPVITYIVTDGAGDTQTSTLTISVTPVSDLSDDNETVTVAEDTTATGNVLDNAETADGPMTVTSFTVDGNTYSAGDTVTLTEGELTLNADGSYTFTPNDNFNGAVPVITYIVTDSAGDTQSSTLTISVTPVSDLSDDSETVTIAEDTTATGNVLDNAETADGPMTVTSFTVGGNTYNAGDTVTLTEGELTLNTDGSYTFTPNDNFNGSVPVISYTITDGAGDTDVSTLTIAVTPVNDPPVAADDNFSVNEGEIVSGNVISHDDGDGVMDNDGGDGASLSVTQVNGVDLVFDPLTGEARVDIKDGFILIKADGSFTYTHNGNDLVGAPPSFNYTLSDGTDVDTGTVTIAVTPVNDPPVAEDDGFNIDEGESVSGNIILHHDGDGVIDTDGGDGSTLVITHINGIELSFGTDGFAIINVEGGILSINASGDFTYQNSEGYVLDATPPSFEYTLTDGIDSDTANVIITVNDSAPVAVDDNNYIIYREKDGKSRIEGIRGNVISKGSSGDNQDTSVDGTVTLIQFEFEGQVYIFDTNNTSYIIDTGFGIFTMYDTGKYNFILASGTDVNTIPTSIEFVYTIQDGDTANPETDNATLTIYFESANANNANDTNDESSALSNGELIDLSFSESATSQSLGNQGSNLATDYDLSDLLVQSQSETFMFDEFSQSDLNTDQESEVTVIYADENLTLENIDQVDALSNTETIITNNFLNKGVTLNSDASSEIVPLPIELDTSDQI